MREGYVDAGEGVFSCTYKEQTFTAELRESGVIRFEGNTFESPSAWSIFVKRKLNPGKKVRRHMQSQHLSQSNATFARLHRLAS